MGAKYLGWVTAERNDIGAISRDLGYMAAVNRLKDNTERMGGTHLVLDPGSRAPRSWTFSHQLSGKAYDASIDTEAAADVDAMVTEAPIFY